MASASISPPVSPQYQRTAPHYEAPQYERKPAQYETMSPQYERTTLQHEKLTPQPEADARQHGARAPSAMSHFSNRSRRSSGSGNKIDLTETHSEKKRLHTKADPSKAINEAQPSAVALEASNLEDLRLSEYKDIEGNVITDPDRSNPTRYRLERPLDTIRSFQAAAEGTSSNRRSTYSGSRPASQIGFDGGNNKRGSYYGSQGFSASPQRPRPAMGGGGYYRNGSYGFRPDSFIEESQGPAQQQHQNREHRRYVSGPSYYSQAAESSPAHSHQQSYDNMTSGSDENSKSTNPSSQNSSFDQLHQMRKPEEYPSEYDAQFSAVNAPRPLAPYYNDAQAANGYHDDVSNQNGGYGYPRQQQRAPMTMSPPRVTGPNNPRVPIKLNSSAGGAPDGDYGMQKSPTKRSGWLKRAFSKKEK